MTLLERDEKMREQGREEGRKEGTLETLIGLVKDDLISIHAAAERVGMTEQEFRKICK